ncbi:hypothetical protein CAPTEDRAFT_134727, partial [Capitella teleta]
TQKVHINEINSSIKHTACYVPQGSILSPLLVVIYINDLNHALECIFPIMPLMILTSSSLVNPYLN